MDFLSLGTAGTLSYWEAWLFLAVLFLPMLPITLYLLRTDPELVERRLKHREERSQQRLIIRLVGLVTLTGFLIPGFDQRFGWSSVPLPVVAAAALVVLGGYLLFMRVLLENSYAGRTIQVEEGPSVITTGPYALVRHPMYTGALAMIVPAPVALGSWWALIPILFVVPSFVVRILDEEKVLLEELPGYSEYKENTRYRLVPGIW